MALRRAGGGGPNRPPARHRTAAALGWAAGALLVAGCSRPESSPTASSPGQPVSKVTFIHDWYPEPEHGGYYAAKLSGIWTREGLDVDVVPGGPNSEIEKRVALDPFGLGIVRGDSVIIAVERGLPIIAVNSYFQHDPQGILVRADSPVRSFADLEGRDLAMQVGATWFLYLQKKYGLKTTRVRPVTGSVANFVKDPDWITQAYPTCEPYYAMKDGVESRFLAISDAGFDPYRVIIANKQLVEKHPELVARFSRGAYLGWQEYFRQPEPVHAHLLKISPTMEPEGMRFSYVKMRELRLVEGDPTRGESMGAVDRRRWEDLGRILVDLGVMKKAPPVEAVMTEAFTPAQLKVDPLLPPPVWTNAPIPRAAGPG